MLNPNPAQDAVLKKLRRKARKWGGDIQKVTEAEWAALTSEDPGIGLLGSIQAPFTNWDLGAHFKSKIVYFGLYCHPQDIEHFATGIIHEMGHVFASLVQPYDLPKTYKGREHDEFDFFGWELTLAKEVGLTLSQFCAGNADYAVTDNGDDIGGIARDGKDGQTELRRIFRERVVFAEKLGLIQHGKAVAIR